MGLFSGRGNLGPGNHRAFAVSTESRASDLLLRFFDTCQSYKVSVYVIVDDLIGSHISAFVYFILKKIFYVECT